MVADCLQTDSADEGDPAIKAQLPALGSEFGLVWTIANYIKAEIQAYGGCAGQRREEDV
jgi:hypothetical protein